MSDRDRLAIEQALEHWNEGWRTRDARRAAQDYSDDADWTNAFGMHRRGRAEIQALLTQVFALPFVMAAESQTVEQSVRFISSRVALVRTRVVREGQLTPSGEPMGARHTTHLRVLCKSGSAWQIVSHLISDARDTGRPEH
jgi:uncharacterized protein (TIGR02246 family)